MKLSALGWNPRFAKAFATLNNTEWLPARVFSENRGRYLLVCESGELTGEISGRLRNLARSRLDYPAVGDWVAIDARIAQGDASIHAVLPRYSIFIRKTAGTKTQEQVLATNIDYIFIVSGLDDNFNIRRIERYITLTWSSGAQPVVILNKADAISDPQQLSEMGQKVATIALGVPIHIISAETGLGLEELQQYFKTGTTVALLGSSGVGKSTLTNRLLGTEHQKIFDTRSGDSKGRHTTTQRQLFLLPSGGLILDTPGMRELQLWMSEEELGASFNDIEELALDCKFTNCTHTSEPGCAVQAAIAAGKLDPSRLVGYCKMLRELQFLADKQQESNWQTRKADRKFGKMCKEIMKAKKQR